MKNSFKMSVTLQQIIFIKSDLSSYSSAVSKKLLRYSLLVIDKHDVFVFQVTDINHHYNYQ